MQEGWWERVGGRGMFREKPRQLTDAGSTAEPPCHNPSPLPLARKRVEKKCPSSKHIDMNTLEYKRHMSAIRITVNNQSQM
jgi:hypothetical protein